MSFDPVQAHLFPGLVNKGLVYAAGATAKTNDRVFLYGLNHQGIDGTALYFENPPVHSIDTIMLRGLIAGVNKAKSLGKFLVVYSVNDRNHVGGNLVESLDRLEKGNIEEALERIDLGVTLYTEMTQLSRKMRSIAIASGKERYGGSVEVMLMPNHLVINAGTGMQLSEATIGLIPGWGGFASIAKRSTLENAWYVASTGNRIDAKTMQQMGLADRVVSIPSADQEHQLLFGSALELAVADNIPPRLVQKKEFMSAQALGQEIAERSEVQRYAGHIGKPVSYLATVGLKRPLSPVSIKALRTLKAATREHFSKSGPAVIASFEGELDKDIYTIHTEHLKEGIRSVLAKPPVIPNFSIGL